MLCGQNRRKLKKESKKAKTEYYNMYYNTNKETGKTLKKSRKQTVKQKEAIFGYIYTMPERFTSPSKLADIFPQWPITSIRRALTDLTNAGKLVKTTRMREGKYGKKEHLWTLKNEFTETLF